MRLLFLLAPVLSAALQTEWLTPRLASAMDSDSRTWDANVDRSRVCDSQSATVSLGYDRFVDWLKLSLFDPNIPDDATVTGLELRVVASSDTANCCYRVNLWQITLYIGGQAYTNQPQEEINSSSLAAKTFGHASFLADGPSFSVPSTTRTTTPLPTTTTTAVFTISATPITTSTTTSTSTTSTTASTSSVDPNTQTLPPAGTDTDTTSMLGDSSAATPMLASSSSSSFAATDESSGVIVVDQTLIYALVGAAAGVVCILLAVVVILVVRKRKSKASVDPLASYNVQMSQMPPALQSLPSTNNSPQYQYQDMPRSDVLFDSMAGNTIAGMLPPQSEVDDGPPSDAPPTAPQSNYVAAPDMTPPMSRGVSRTNVRDGGSMARAPSGIYDVFDESVVYSVFQ